MNNRFQVKLEQTHTRIHTRTLRNYNIDICVGLAFCLCYICNQNGNLE